MQISTPEILWHGGGIENGKPDPVFSVDIHHPTSILATAGIDASIPPKGSVRLWHIDHNGDSHEFIIDLSDHQSSVNVVRFSPCGKMLASASDRMVVIYSVVAGCTWANACEIRNVERTWLRPSLCEMYDLCWSPDSSYILACSIDQKAEIIRVSSRDSIILPGHTHYVQGVAWDPLNQMVITQSADRSIKLHMLKTKAGFMTKLAPKGHTVIKMLDNAALTGTGGGSGTNATSTSSIPLTAADFTATAIKGKNLYADSTVPSFFRRPAFSPDGALFVTPSGIFKHPTVPTTTITPATATTATTGNTINGEVPTAAVASASGKGKVTTEAVATATQSFCTHIFARNYTTTPLVSLVGLEDPSVAVRFSPVLYKHIKITTDDVTSPTATTVTTPAVPVPLGKSRSSMNKKDTLLHNNNNNNSMIPGRYRMIYAVLTVSAVMVYDTQFPHPIARFGGLHLACINDATWTADGNTLIVCSSDGYVSFIHFEPGALGEPIPDDEVPDSVKQTHASIYLQPTATAASATTATSTTTQQGTKEVVTATVGIKKTNIATLTTPSVLMTQIMNDRKNVGGGDRDEEKDKGTTDICIIYDDSNDVGTLAIAEHNTSKRERDDTDITNNNGEYNCENATTIATKSNTTAGAATTGNEKKKKRVALTFVSALGAHHINNNAAVAPISTTTPAVAVAVNSALSVSSSDNNNSVSSSSSDSNGGDVINLPNVAVHETTDAIIDTTGITPATTTSLLSVPTTIKISASAANETMSSPVTIMRNITSNNNNSNSSTTDPNAQTTGTDAAVIVPQSLSSSANGKIKKRVTTTLISSTPLSFSSPTSTTLNFATTTATSSPLSASSSLSPALITSSSSASSSSSSSSLSPQQLVPNVTDTTTGSSNEITNLDSSSTGSVNIK